MFCTLWSLFLVGYSHRLWLLPHSVERKIYLKFVDSLSRVKKICLIRPNFKCSGINNTFRRSNSGYHMSLSHPTPTLGSDVQCQLYPGGSARLAPLNMLPCSSWIYQDKCQGYAIRKKSCSLFCVSSRGSLQVTHSFWPCDFPWGSDHCEEVVEHCFLHPIDFLRECFALYGLLCFWSDAATGGDFWHCQLTEDFTWSLQSPYLEQRQIVSWDPILSVVEVTMLSGTSTVATIWRCPTTHWSLSAVPSFACDSVLQCPCFFPKSNMIWKLAKSAL